MIRHYIPNVMIIQKKCVYGVIDSAQLIQAVYYNMLLLHFSCLHPTAVVNHGCPSDQACPAEEAVFLW